MVGDYCLKQNALKKANELLEKAIKKTPIRTSFDQYLDQHNYRQNLINLTKEQIIDIHISTLFDLVTKNLISESAFELVVQSALSLEVFSRDIKIDNEVNRERLFGILQRENCFGIQSILNGIKVEKTIKGRTGALAKDKKSGQANKRDSIRAIWAKGKYSSRDICAERECAALGMSFSSARKALRGTPDPT